MNNIETRVKQLLRLGLLVTTLASPIVALNQLGLGGSPVEAQEEYRAYLPLVAKEPILHQPDISQVPLPEIIFQIPPFPSDISITNPGYWPDIPWGEYESTEPGRNAHGWAGTFEGLYGIDSQGQVYLGVDLDISSSQDLKRVVLPTNLMPTVFTVCRLQQGDSEIYQTTDPNEIYAILSLPNWFKPTAGEPIEINIWRDVVRQDGTQAPPQIRITAWRISSQNW